jgi:hypothetical protein
VCREETRNPVQQVPSEECEIEPRENCRMETVMLPK